MTRAVKIGIFFILCSCCAGIYMYKSADFFEGDTKTYFALADDAMGLLRDSNVLVAGVVTGKLDKIGLENGKATALCLLALTALTRDVKFPPRSLNALAPARTQIAI